MNFYVHLKYTLPAESPINLIDQSDSQGSLYLGNLDCVLNPQILVNHNINYVLSICTEEKIKLTPPFQQLHIDLHDHIETKISDEFDNAFTFILNALKQKRNVLVHCAAGISRSSTLVIAYLMKTKRWLLQDALRYVKQKRSFVRPNPGFLLQLLDFERKLFGEIRSILTSDITPFEVQNNKKYAPSRKQSNYSVPLRKVEGKAAMCVKRATHKAQTEKLLTKVNSRLCTLQPSPFNV